MKIYKLYGDYTISKVKPGDKLLIYVKQERIDKDVKESRIMAVYEVVSEVFRDSKKIFKSPKGMGNEVFPYRIKIKPIKIFSKSALSSEKPS